MPRRGKASVRGWDRTFDDPIPLPGGGELITLRHAATYITKLPKSLLDVARHIAS
jgi:hypothetical protein